MKDILITGVNGFLGSHLARELAKDYRVIGFEHPESDLNRIKDLGLNIYTSIDVLKQVFEENRIWSIIHTATIYKNKTHLISDLLSTNIILPVKLFELANRHNCSLFLNTDTFFNNSKYNYSYLPEYTLSKKHAIDWLKTMAANCKLINAKIHHMYGPNDSEDKFVPKILLALKNNVQSIDLTPGEQKRDFVFIHDVVDAYRVVLDNQEEFTNSFCEFEVGTGKTTSLKTFLETAKRITNSRSALNFGALTYRKGEIMSAKADNYFLNSLGWRYKYDISLGLQEICKYG